MTPEVEKLGEMWRAGAIGREMAEFLGYGWSKASEEKQLIRARVYSRVGQLRKLHGEKLFPKRSNRKPNSRGSKLGFMDEVAGRMRKDMRDYKSWILEQDMIKDLIDENGDLNEAALEQLWNWPPNDQGGCFDFVKILWEGEGWREDGEDGSGRRVVIAETGFLPRNDMILAALNANRPFWYDLVWFSKAGSGIFEFRLETG